MIQAIKSLLLLKFPARAFGWLVRSLLVLYPGEVELEQLCRPSHFSGFIMTFKFSDSFEVSEKKTLGRESSNPRIKALACVPFSSVFYCSNPVAALLTRNIFIAACLLSAIVGYAPEVIHVQSSRASNIRASSKVKFTNLQQRDGCRVNASSVEEMCVLGPGIAHFGLIRGTEDVNLNRNTSTMGPSVILYFPSVVHWDSWYFVTTDTDPERDSIRFVLESQVEDDTWETVGSSMSMQVSKNTYFLHTHEFGTFATSLGRAERHELDSLGPTLFGYYLVRWIGDGHNLVLAFLGAIGRECLASHVPVLMCVLFSCCQLIAAFQADTSRGDYSAVSYLFFGLMMGGAGYFHYHFQFLNATLWISSMLIIASLAILVHERDAAFVLLIIGVPQMLITLWIKCVQFWRRRRALLHIESDRFVYQVRALDSMMLHSGDYVLLHFQGCCLGSAVMIF